MVSLTDRKFRIVCLAILSILSVVAFFYFLTIALQSAMLSASPGVNLRALSIAFWVSLTIIVISVIAFAWALRGLIKFRNEKVVPSS